VTRENKKGRNKGIKNEGRLVNKVSARGQAIVPLDNLELKKLKN